jgi:subtilisin family serine protease
MRDFVRLSRVVQMVTVIFTAAAAMAAGAAAPSGGAASASGAAPGPPAPAYVDDALLVSFTKGAPYSVRRADLGSVGANVVRQYIGGTELLRVPSGTVRTALAHLRSRGHVRFAEPDYVMDEDGVPDDPSFGLQWGYQNTGQTVNSLSGAAGADEHVVPAWGVTTGSRSIVVGEVDSGVDYNHPDLAANIWSNPGGVGGCAAGTHGYNVLTSVCDPLDDETVYGGHGTHVAGIIGAVGNNGRGVTGVNWATTILPVKWLDSSGGGTTSGLISALDWLLKAQAAGVNIRVVNDSATSKGDAYSQALSDEIDLLGQHNILFVSAAGNTGDDNDTLSLRRYPCGYDRPTEICVTASDQNDALPSWANYGPATVDLAAPGNNIYSTLRNGTYGYISGGSMASPQVAGAAALILSTSNMSAANLKADILANVDPVPALTGLVRTGGRLDICKALPGCTASSPPVDTVLPVISGTAQQGQTLTVSNGSWSNSPTGFGYQWQRCTSSCAAIGGATSSSYTAAAVDVGDTLKAIVTATNGGGSSSAASNPTATIQPAAAAGSNVARSATLTASSENASTGQLAVKAADGFTDGCCSGVYTHEWATIWQQAGAWLNLAWAAPQTLSSVVLYDRPNLSDQVLAGTLSFSDGSQVSVAALNNDGSPLVVSFSARAVSWMRFTVTQTSASSVNIGLAEIEAWTSGSPPPPTPPPVDTVLPVISGTAQQGQTLTVSNGSWSNSPTGFGYQWQRCVGGSCSSVSGATAASYAVVAADVGDTLEVAVTATNGGGSAVARSLPTGSVLPPAAGSGTFGTTTVGGIPDTMLSDRKRANHYQLSVAGSVSKLSIYLQPTGTSGTQVIKGVLYADSTGKPGALVATTLELSFSSGQLAGWYDMVFPSAVALAAGNYWIGMISGASSHVAGFRYAPVSGSRAYNANSYASGPTDPFGSAMIDDEEMSEYATYTTG